MNTPFQDFLDSFREEVRFPPTPDAQLEVCSSCHRSDLAWVYAESGEKLVQVCQRCGACFCLEVWSFHQEPGSELAKLVLKDHLTEAYIYEWGRAVHG